MDAITNKLASALQDLYLECRAMRWNGMGEEMKRSAGALEEYRNAVGKEILAATNALLDMDDEPRPLHLLVVGNPVDGFSYVGPFDNLDTLSEYEDGLSHTNWWRGDLLRPEEYLP